LKSAQLGAAQRSKNQKFRFQDGSVRAFADDVNGNRRWLASERATNRLKSLAICHVYFGLFLRECYGLVDSWVETLAISVASVYVYQIVGIQLRAADR
jgi:hypothetical protein